MVFSDHLFSKNMSKQSINGKRKLREKHAKDHLHLAVKQPLALCGVFGRGGGGGGGGSTGTRYLCVTFVLRAFELSHFNLVSNYFLNTFTYNAPGLSGSWYPRPFLLPL